LKESDFILKEFNLKNTTLGSVTWKTPSNIALVKYWGKQEPQIPENASVSFTLDACYTLTTLEYKKLDNERSATSSEVQHPLKINSALKFIFKVKKKMTLSLKFSLFSKESKSMFRF